MALQEALWKYLQSESEAGNLGCNRIQGHIFVFQAGRSQEMDGSKVFGELPHCPPGPGCSGPGQSYNQFGSQFLVRTEPNVTAMSPCDEASAISSQTCAP